MFVDTAAAPKAQDDDLEFHPLANIFPLMEGEEFEALVADIGANGQHEPIVLYEGKILDGRNRYRACLAANAEPRSWADPEIYNDDIARAYVVSRNIRRRHLTAEQKRALLAKLIKAQPERSNRQVAAAAQVSPTFVGTVRSELEAAGDVSTVDTRIDTKGRRQRAKKAIEPAKDRKPNPWAASAAADDDHGVRTMAPGDDTVPEMNGATARAIASSSTAAESPGDKIAPKPKVNPILEAWRNATAEQKNEFSDKWSLRVRIDDAKTERLQWMLRRIMKLCFTNDSDPKNEKNVSVRRQLERHDININDCVVRKPRKNGSC